MFQGGCFYPAKATVSHEVVCPPDRTTPFDSDLNLFLLRARVPFAALFVLILPFFPWAP